MNNEQRKRLQTAIDIFTEVAGEEREKYENAPEGLQDTERVQKFEEDADNIEEAATIVTNILEGV